MLGANNFDLIWDTRGTTGFTYANTASGTASELGSVVLTYNYTPASVPEPETLVLMMTGLLGFAGYRKRRHV
jgi:hypothetical protein